MHLLPFTIKVVGLERGQDRTPGEDFTLPGVRDEMKYSRSEERRVGKECA